MGESVLIVGITILSLGVIQFWFQVESQYDSMEGPGCLYMGVGLVILTAGIVLRVWG